ncbi:hypothetical protein EMPS_05193 [Entomortierella parvispora]|uniref:F-box domain-containing protein n=1 Tax=Entomortierella parvispora TaxID=205924 RepID=A0A9P3LWH7_9FUNG|nr:hypothetical protein EMPS_05193 [Entomortierella parvispora]
MPTRPDPPEGDGKASRSYSLASAPLRLLSHSFHSTANNHNAPGHGTHLSEVQPLVNFESKLCTLDPIPNNTTSTSEQLQPEFPSKTAETTNPLHPPPPSVTTLPRPEPQSLSLKKQTYQVQQQHQQLQLQQSFDRKDVHGSSSTTTACTDDDAHWALAQPSQRIVRQEEHTPIRKTKSTTIPFSVSSAASASIITATSTTTPPPVSSAQTDVSVGVDGLQLLDRLLMPYDIRYSIFGHLSLHDIYNCQLTCKLLLWATSDQSVWKRIALNLIQGEFYFDIPRTLPAKIPNWKYFCKRHLLRQRNWRRGEVQDIISLDDNYQKLTTLQIMAPFVLTGCSDGRVHLWNINTRTLLHRFQIRGEITWVEHLQEQQIVAGLGYDIDNMRSEIRLFSTETGEELGVYEEEFWDLAICAINGDFLVASDGEGRYTAWNWRTGAKVSQFKVPDETSITEALYLVQNTILELHYDGMIRLFSITGECYGRFTLDKILPNNQVSFCWLHNDFSMVVWESSNTMAHLRLPLLQKSRSPSSSSENDNPHHPSLDRPITQEEWDAQGAEIYWRHQLTHTCNFAAMGGGRFQLLYVQIFENLMDQVPIRVHSLRHSNGHPTGSLTLSGSSASSSSEAGSSASSSETPRVGETEENKEGMQVDGGGDEGYGWQHGEYVTAHSQNPELEKIIQGLRPSRIDCDPEYIVVGLVQGGVRLLQFAPVDTELLEQEPA